MYFSECTSDFSAKFKNTNRLFALADVLFYMWKGCFGWLNNMLGIPCRSRVAVRFQTTVIFFLLLQISLHSGQSKGHNCKLPKFMARRYGWFRHSGLPICTSLKMSRDIYVPADPADRTTTTSLRPLKTYVTVTCKLELGVLTWPSNRVSRKCLMICRF